MIGLSKQFCQNLWTSVMTLIIRSIGTGGERVHSQVQTGLNEKKLRFY